MGCKQKFVRSKLWRCTIFERHVTAIFNGNFTEQITAVAICLLTKSIACIFVPRLSVHTRQSILIKMSGLDK
jgi:hypothetical protein